MQPVRKPAMMPAVAPVAAQPARPPPARTPAPSPAAALQSRIGNAGMRQMLDRRHPKPPPGGGEKAVTTGHKARHRHDGEAPAGAARAGAAKPGDGPAKAAAPAAETPLVADAKPAAAGPPVKLHMPEPPRGPSPATLKRIQGVQGRARGKAAAQADLPAAEKQVGDAQQAVTPPETERAARAQRDLIAAVKAAPSPEIVELCQRIRQVIRDKRPVDEDALEEANPEAAAADAGSQLNATVQGETQKVQDNYGAVETTPAAPAAPKATDLPGQPQAAATPAVNAAAAKPDAVPAENLSLDADAAEARQKTQAAGMDKPAAQLVQSGPIAEARAAQGEFDEAAKEGPAQLIARQEQALGKAEADMASLGAEALAALSAARQGTVKRTDNRQRGMVGSEEAMRLKAGEEAQAAFLEAQSHVKGLLKNLPQKAMEEWEQAKKLLVDKFKNELAIVKKWVDDRHSGVGGKLLAIGDYFTGLPDEITDAYTRAESNFADGVIEKLLAISTRVNAVIETCNELIKTARDKIAKTFDDLPESLRTWADQEKAKFGQQLDALEKEAADTRDNFNKNLKQQASAAVNEVRTEIAELRKKAAGLAGRIAAAVGRFLDDPVKFIIDGLLELLGISPAAFWAVVAKIKKYTAAIADDPLGFGENLLKGLGQGFSQFFDNFGTHLIEGFLNWLFGDLKGVQVPKDFSLKSVVTFFLQLMGITWPNIRKILVKLIGPQNVALIERTWSLVSMLLEKGPAGILEMIEEQLNPQVILDQVIEMAVDYMVEAIVKQVAARLLLLFNPVGAILQALEAIYKVLKWVFQNAARIFKLVETVVNGIGDIIAGNVAGFAAAVEKGLAMLIPPVIAFIADYFSLGDLPKAVAEKIKSMQTWVLGMIEKALGWIIEKGKALLAKVGIGKKKEEKKGGEGAIGETITIDAPGETHALYIETKGSAAVLMIASTPMTVPQKLQSFRARLGEVDKKKYPKIETTLAKAEALATETKKDADALFRGQADPAGTAQNASAGAGIVSEEQQLAELLKELFTAFGEHGTPPRVGTYGDLKADPHTDQEAHHVPPKGVLSWIVDVAKHARDDVKTSVIAKGVEYDWVRNLAGIAEPAYNPGAPLAAIAIHKETHIKKSGDPDQGVWRVHWGSETAKAVCKMLGGKKVTVNVGGVPTQLDMVFIRRKLFDQLSPEDQATVKEMEKEAEQPLTGAGTGAMPDAIGVAISTQFFKTELWAALEEAQGKAELDLERLADKLGMVARGAAAMSHAAVTVALKVSKRDGTEDEKAKALSELAALSSETWNALPGITVIRML